MPLPTVTITQDLGPATTVTPAVDGAIYGIGGAPSQYEVGGANVSFVPNDAFVGSFVIVGRPGVKDASDDNVGLVPYPFRAFYLNGAVSDLSMQPSGTAITARSDLLVPASGARLGIQVSCSQGACTIYTQAVVGSTAP